MINQVRVSIAKAAAEACNGKLVSSKRQLNNETYMFQFDAKPGKTYGIYASGAVRCIGRGQRQYPQWGSTFMTPLLFNNVGEGRREIRRVSFDEGLSYLINRFLK